MNRWKLIKKNINYFIPILFKNNPFSVIILIINAILDACAKIIWVVFPALIIEELQGDKDLYKLMTIVVIFAVTLFIIRVVRMILNTIQDYYVTKTNFYIDQLFNEKIARVDYFNIEDPEFNDELSYAKKCLNEYSNGIYSVTYYLESILGEIITLGGTIGVFIYSQIHPLIMISLIAVIILCTILSSIIQKKNIKLEDDYNKFYVRIGRIHWYFSKSIMNFNHHQTLRGYNGKNIIEKYSNETYSEINRVNIKYRNDGNKVIVLSMLTMYLMRTLLPLLILIFVSFRLGITIAVFTMIFQNLNTINSSLSSLIYFIKYYNQEINYQDNFINLMNKESIFKNGNEPLEKLESIEFKNVSFKYPKTDNYILQNISFKIDNKQKVSLVGLNGAGKTTIIKLLCRFYEVLEGEILVNGINIKNYKYDDYMKQLSVVFQDFKIISFTVKDNIVIIDENEEKLESVLKRSDIYDKLQNLPNKENTFINKWFERSGVEFSGGEMQKIAIARALYKDSDLVILDEPTSALDPVAEAKIYYHFNEVVGKKLCLFISHRLSSCIFSDRIMVLDGSKLVESGTHEELMSNKDGLYYKMFNAQAEYYK